MALTLIVHELATNAAKYGALSTDRGHVAIIWERGEGPDLLLVFRWIEQGGPPVWDSGHRGFGTPLIELMLDQVSASQIAITSTDAGLRAEFMMPLTTNETVPLTLD
jgi:two-component sensor histidine kinase